MVLTVTPPAPLSFKTPRPGGGWHEATVLVCLPLAPIGLSPSYIPTLGGSERVFVVSTEPLDDVSCLTTPGVESRGGGGLEEGGWRGSHTRPRLPPTPPPPGTHDRLLVRLASCLLPAPPRPPRPTARLSAQPPPPPPPVLPHGPVAKPYTSSPWDCARPQASRAGLGGGGAGGGRSCDLSVPHPVAASSSDGPSHPPDARASCGRQQRTSGSRRRTCGGTAG